MKPCQEENPVDVSILFLAPLFLSCQSSGAELCFTLFYFCVNPAEYIHVNIQTCVLSLSNQTFMMLSYAAKCSRMNFYSSIKQSVNRRWNFSLKHLDVWTLLWGADSPYTSHHPAAQKHVLLSELRCWKDSVLWCPSHPEIIPVWMKRAAAEQQLSQKTPEGVAPTTTRKPAQNDIRFKADWHTMADLWVLMRWVRL